MNSLNLRRILSLFHPTYEVSLCYMLQRTDYKTSKFLKWFFNFPNFLKVSSRGELKKTIASKLILLSLRLIRISILLLVVMAVISHKASIPLAIFSILFTPIIQALVLVLVIPAIKFLIVNPSNKRMNGEAKTIFASSKAIKIAVLGSYGKTTVKEILAKVLSSNYTVAYTHDNMNTQIAHARFAQRLMGKEDFIIIEFGEERLGDIAKMASITRPDYAIITGMAPVHLDYMKSVENIGKDLSSILDFVSKDNVFWNKDSSLLKEYMGSKLHSRNSYSMTSALDSRITNIETTEIRGLSFKINDLRLKTKFIGKHLVGPIALAASLALRFKVPKETIEAIVHEAEPFYARMQPIKIGGAFVINDGYNGNIEGIEAGISTLKNLKTSGKKFYATPGLIAQGEQNIIVHREIARLLSLAGFDKIYLFSNNNTKIILNELRKLKSHTKVEVIEEPLLFLNNLHSFLANNDILLIQNDLPDEAELY